MVLHHGVEDRQPLVQTGRQGHLRHRAGGPQAVIEGFERWFVPRGDDADEQQGTAHLFMMFEPLAGPRQAKVTERRTAVDFAQLIQGLVDAYDPQAEKIVLVDEALAPAEARCLMARLARHDTPKPGRWSHMADTDRSVLATPGVDRRIPDPPT